MPLEINPVTFKKAIKSLYNMMLPGDLLVSFQKNSLETALRPQGIPKIN